MKVNTMAELMMNGETPDILFWVGCAGSFDQRAQKITKAFATILDKVGYKFAILGKEEACTGDPARRAGNEFLFQMMAYQNIQVLNGYGIKKIVTTCPHCFNTLKNEYPELGGNYEVIHHTTLLQQLIDEFFRAITFREYEFYKYTNRITGRIQKSLAICDRSGYCGNDLFTFCPYRNGLGNTTPTLVFSFRVVNCNTVLSVGYYFFYNRA